LDQLYVRHHSLWLDLDILFWTILVLLPALQSFIPQEDLLFLGPISRLSQRYLNWFLVDTLITFLSISLAGIIWRFFVPLDIGWGPALGIAFGFALLFSLTGAVLGMHRIAWSQAWASDSIGLLFSATLAGSIALFLNQAGEPNPVLPPGMIILSAFLACGGFVSVRYRSRMITGLAFRWTERTGSTQVVRERVLIVGGGYAGQFVAWLLNNGPSREIFRVVGFVDDDLYKQGIRFRGAKVMGRRNDIQRLVEQQDIGIIIFAIHNICAAEREHVLGLCNSTPARVVSVPDIIGDLNSIILEMAKQGNHSQPTSRPAGSNGDPVFTSRGIPPVRVQLWLAELEKRAKTGDLAAVNGQIRAMREGIREFTGGEVGASK
jgi:hypothetical protein